MQWRLKGRRLTPPHSWKSSKVSTKYLNFNARELKTILNMTDASLKISQHEQLHHPPQYFCIKRAILGKNSIYWISQTIHLMSLLKAARAGCTRTFQFHSNMSRNGRIIAAVWRYFIFLRIYVDICCSSKSSSQNISTFNSLFSRFSGQVVCDVIRAEAEQESEIPIS